MFGLALLSVRFEDTAVGELMLTVIGPVRVKQGFWEKRSTNPAGNGLVWENPEISKPIGSGGFGKRK